MRPKVLGAWHLHELIGNEPLDFFVLYSSVAALVGSPGQANYAAANSFLDGLAALRHGRGQPALSINWGPWSEVGLAAARVDRGDRLALRGIDSLEPQRAMLAFEGLLAHKDLAQVSVMHFDAQRWCEAYPQAATTTFLATLREHAQAARARTPELRDLLLAAESGKQRRAVLETYLRHQLAGVLGLDIGRVNVAQPFKALGLDSLMALEFRNRLEAGLALTLSATLVWNYPSIGVLVPFLLTQLGIPFETEPTHATVHAAEPVKDAGVALLEHVSTDDLEAMLADELAEIDELLRSSRV
jgi:myxalamid-type polyketide synthase MxaC